MEPDTQRHGSAFTLCHTLLKKAILHHTGAAMPFFLSTSEASNYSEVHGLIGWFAWEMLQNRETLAQATHSALIKLSEFLPQMVALLLYYSY